MDPRRTESVHESPAVRPTVVRAINKMPDGRAARITAGLGEGARAGTALLVDEPHPGPYHRPDLRHR